VGKDGARPGDEGYTGPDEGEGDGVPTQGEPDFGVTDIDESDQIGLTSVDIFTTHDIEIEDDDKIWASMSEFTFNTEIQQSLTSLIYGSGPINLESESYTDFSIAMVFGDNLDDLIRNKQTVQEIYNSNYNFAKPPLKPNLTAIPGDGKVTLYWDRRSEKSKDPFLGYKEDFEGYKIYRSTDASFLEIKTITDAYGNPVYRKPLAGFDLINGIIGPDPILVNGASFDRGNDTGLQHVYVDSTVENGQLYYYAITAYDQGEPDLGTQGLSVTETTTIITVDASGNVIFTDINTAVVTPNAPVLGYQSAQIAQDITAVGNVFGTGEVYLEIVDPNAVLDNATYHIIFQDEGMFTSSYSVINVAESLPDTVILGSELFGRDEHNRLVEGDVFDGLRLFVDNDGAIELIDSLSGWSSDSDCEFEGSVEISTAAKPYPADYDIVFYDEIVGTDSSSLQNDVNFTVTNISEGREVYFVFQDLDNNDFWTSSDRVLIYDKFSTGRGKTWRLSLRDTTSSGAQRPGSGDVYRIRTTKPFREGDVLEFITKGSAVSEEIAKSSLDNIAVVPNPYLAVASWEKKQTNSSGIGSRGERRIDFIHLPQNATIRIYTLRGDLVDIIKHNSTIDDGAASWDLRTREGLDVAFGIYVYHVDAGSLGSKIGKFALIK